MRRGHLGALALALACGLGPVRQAVADCVPPSLLGERVLFPPAGSTVPPNARFVIVYHGGGFEPSSLGHLHLERDDGQTIPFNLQLVGDLGSEAEPSTTLVLTPATDLPSFTSLSLYDGAVVPCPAIGQCSAQSDVFIASYQVGSTADTALPALTSSVHRQPSAPLVCDSDTCCATPLIVRNQLDWSAGRDPDGPPPLYLLSNVGGSDQRLTGETSVVAARICSGSGRTPGVRLVPGIWNLQAVDQAGHLGGQSTFVLDLHCPDDDTADAGPLGIDGGPGEPADEASGCGCQAGGRSAPSLTSPLLSFLALLSLAALRLRGRARRGSR
jgi:hypothetical protein